MRTMSAAALCLLLAACGGDAPRSEAAPDAAAPAVPIVARDTDFACTPTRVWDGDGPIWCAEGPRIRLAGIAAREMDGSCRPGHPCPDATADQAKAALVDLLGGRRGGSRTAAWCTMPDQRDLSCAMVGTGAVGRWAKFDRSGALLRC
jgi:endonuclease YncB( thermonuclease family)